LLASELSQKLTPFGVLTNSKALSVNYRAFSVGPNSINACSAFGALETAIDTGLDKQIFVDGDSFFQVMKSLPAAALEMKVTDQSLMWKCGSAKGQLALLGDAVEIVKPEWSSKIEFQDVSSSFSKALDLGSIACGTTALLSVGLYGVVIDNDNGLFAYSTDNNTIASAKLGDVLKKADKCYLSPDSSRLVSMLTGKEGAKIAIDGEKSLFIQTNDSKLVVKQIPPIKFDIKKMVSMFSSQEIKIMLNRDVIAAFIRRADALAEEKGKASVAIGVDNGTVKLEFAEGKSSSEEYYLAEGATDINVEPIVVDSRRMAKALSNVNSLIFDYASKGALVLRGADEFVFVVSGKTS
jgi:hypothetical protein